MCLRGAGTDLSDRRRPTLQRVDAFEARVVTINRRHRPSLVLRTSDAERAGVWPGSPDVRAWYTV